ncbi:helix-turn-helix domain-containing protein [Sphingobacterium paludis]|uniref:Helix-turn-helix protein n=1 Tax=Sphingobacterium paludis TaxID=1476465 RepID=A0A4R7CWV7_9SPHI|nr:helix-turn-helix transcriptional regulator [Sphingobacterium paludis]TDS12342.1 helix-turn-helix protein [Sphingobacterium paludis]
MAIKPQYFFLMNEKYAQIYTRIGRNLKKRRIELGLTQDQLAKKTSKIDRSKISDIENGKEDFMFSTLLELATALEVDVEELTKNSTSNTFT